MYQSEINSVMQSFIPVRLNEMNHVSLMNRVERKFIFPVKLIPEILDNLKFDYMALDIERSRSFRYHTTYLDTKEMFFLNQQVNGKLNRFKIRYRVYEDSGLSFLEIKKRTNRNSTLKWRIKNDLTCVDPDENGVEFIDSCLNYYPEGLRPVLINRFSRSTLVGISSGERLTIDYNIGFTSIEGKTVELPFLAIAEVKKERISTQTPVNITMKKFGVKPCGFSKYSIGNVLVNDICKKNILKEKLLLIKKIEDECK
jgi:hypothetical protein